MVQHGKINASNPLQKAFIIILSISFIVAIVLIGNMLLGKAMNKVNYGAFDGGNNSTNSASTNSSSTKPQLSETPTQQLSGYVSKSLTEYGVKVKYPQEWELNSININASCNNYKLSELGKTKCNTDSNYKINDIVLSNTPLKSPSNNDTNVPNDYTYIKFSPDFNSKKSCSGCQYKNYPFTVDGKNYILALGYWNNSTPTNNYVYEVQDDKKIDDGISAGKNTNLSRFLITLNFSVDPNDQQIQEILNILSSIETIK